MTCKYVSQQDSNYISVRDVLRSLVCKFGKKELQIRDTNALEDARKLEKLLSVSEAPDDDYDFFSQRWMPGSCEWILSEASFKIWMEDSSSAPRILWLRGIPGTCKSVLSSFVIRQLRQMELGCQFYFFRFGDQRKTSLNAFLRSLACQIARDVPEYRRRILKLSDDDLRDSFCNIWEPNALIRLAEADEKASETSSAMGTSAQLPLASEISTKMEEPITALAVSPRTSTYCAGSDEGILTLSKNGANEIVELSKGFMTVDHILWSGDEKTLATADLSGRVTVKSINLFLSTSEKVILQTTTEGSIQQLLLSPLSKYLLVSTSQFANVWSLDSKSIVATRMFPNSSRRWSNHPHNADMLVCFGFASVQLRKWADLMEALTVQIDRTTIDIDGADNAPHLLHEPSARYPVSPSGFEDFVDKTFVTPGGSLLIVETSRASDRRRRKKQFMIIKTSDVTAGPSEDTARPIISTPLPEEILTRIEMLLGFLTSDIAKTFWSFHSNAAIDTATSLGTAVLGFLDKDFWVCTGSLGGSGARTENGNGRGVKRHFFLPSDWLNMECLELAIMTKEGTFLCPRNGEVAVVTGGLREEWIG